MAIKKLAMSCFVFTLLVTILTFPLNGQILAAEGSQDMEALFAHADFVGLGVVDKVNVRHIERSGGQKPFTTETDGAIIRIIRVYKGNREIRIKLSFQTQKPAVSALLPGVDPGESALFFLTKSPDGTYVFADNQWGALRMGKITLSSDVAPGLVQLQHDAASSLSGDDQEDSDILRILLGYRSTDLETEERVKPLSKNSNARVAAEALAVLLTTGKPKYYEELLTFLKNRGREVPADALLPIAARIQNSYSDTDIKVLDELSNMDLGPIKFSAMEGIRVRRSSESIPTLVRHLDDPDATIRYLSVRTLNEIVPRGDAFGPSMYDFDQNSKPYVDSWKKWWAEEGKTRYASPPH